MFFILFFYVYNLCLKPEDLQFLIFTWFALFVLKFATMLLESTALIFKLLLLLLLLLTLLFTFRTRVRTPAANAAKSKAFPVGRGNF
jgi:hypothetical protein